MKGKAYANKKKKEDRPEGDFYSTPKSLVWVAEEIIKREFPKDSAILEAASGENLIARVLNELDYIVITNDLFNEAAKFRQDYTRLPDYVWIINIKHVITNPPFSLWDEFVNKAKTHCRKFMFIGKLNFFGTTSRHESGIWNNLKAVYPFNRYVDYRTPYREDGLFHVGALATGWFLWDMDYTGKPTVDVLDVQEYAKLGAYKTNQTIAQIEVDVRR